MGEPESRRFLERHLHLLDGGLLKAQVRDPIRQSFRQMILRGFDQRDDSLLEGGVIYSVFNTVVGGGRPQVRPEDEIDEHVLSFVPLFVTQAQDAPKHQIFNKDSIHYQMNAASVMP
jgi:hypothetical protein